MGDPRAHGHRGAGPIERGATLNPLAPADTAALYHLDAYVREFEATVLAADSAGLVLDRTAFFPGGGGQPADRGALAWGGEEHPLAEVLKRGDQVLHRLIAGDPPAPGTRVQGRLDWEHRYALMRTHTALHILCGVIWRDFGAQVTGSNMKPLSARMDFELEGMPGDLARTIEERVAAEIAADREIKVSFLPREEALAIPDLVRTKVNLIPATIPVIRIVDIVGLDFQADGGTHVARTGEVGRMRVVKHESKGRINKRLTIAIEDPA
jgi:misacylated tRNA(Ala) deacylase